MSGDESYRAVLADCERALGKPDAALRLVAEAFAAHPDDEQIVELHLVEAGARQDLGELAAAALVLETALGGRPGPEMLLGADLGRLRLATAYADLLQTRGDTELAEGWFAAITAADPEDRTGVAERLSDIEFDDDELVDDVNGDEDAVTGEPMTDHIEATGVLPVDAVPAEANLRDPAEEIAELVMEGSGDIEDVGPGYDSDEQDVENEVAELLGEIPTPGFSDDEVSATGGHRTGAAPSTGPASTGLFQAAELPEEAQEAGSEHDEHERDMD